jgi:hypothetical protein
MTDLLDQALDQDVPLRVDLVPDWDEVLARAHVERASPPRRRRVLRLSLVAAGVSVVAVSAALALWPSGKGGVLERARAAVGSGPVIHVVFRDEVHETLVDLTTGRRTPLYEEHEQWYDAGRGLRDVVRFNGHVQSEQVYGAGNLPPQAAQTYAGVFDGYRRALDEGTATIRGEGTLGGRRVIWIHLKGERLIDVGDGKYHEWTHEIAVDACRSCASRSRRCIGGRCARPSTGSGSSCATDVSAPVWSGRR